MLRRRPFLPMPRRFVPAASALALTITCVAGPASLANGEDPLAGSLGLSRSTAGPSLLAKPDVQDVENLSQQVPSVNPSVFIIGHPEGGYGTGFVISKEHRLLATNAHVADIRHEAGELLAIGNGSAEVFHVDQVWYHPGVLRKSEGVIFRSTDAARGGVYPAGPDVAVLHIAGDLELPAAVPLAERSELFNLFGKAVAMIGFPGHDTVAWPQLGASAKASYGDGSVARVTDFLNDADAGDRDQQFLRHTIQSWGGFSGSPIFLANGHVAALHNSGGSIQENGRITSLAYGIRVDCLWELLAYHDLQDEVAVPIPRDELRLTRFEGEDPRIKDLQDVEDLVARGRILMNEEKYDRAGRLLNEAIRRMPSCAIAHHWNSRNYRGYIFKSFGSTKDAIQRGQFEAYIKQLEFALKESQKAYQLEPDNMEYLVGLLSDKQELAYGYGGGEGRKDRPEDRIVLEPVMNRSDLPAEIRSLAYGVYAGSFSSVKESLPWDSQAIEIDPYNDDHYEDRANDYKILGQPAQAEADRQRAEQLTSAHVAHLKAWRLATSPVASVRDGAEAVRLAKQACEATDYYYWKYVDGLAAAYAETGDFDQAIHWASEAVKLAPAAKKSAVSVRLRSYRHSDAWRD